MSSNIEVAVSGPLFDGRAGEAMDQLGDTVLDRVSDYAVDEIRRVVRDRAKRRTGTYESNVRVNPTAHEGSRLVTDSSVVYGPWLEGTASRNTRTDFKGYAMFRRTVQAIRSQGVIERIGGEVFSEMKGDFNG